MKKLIVLAMLLMMSTVVFAQNHNQFRRKRQKSLTVQVAPSVFSYNNQTVFGIHAGLNFKERLSVSYFAMRDYDFSEGVKDYGWYGVNAVLVFPVFDNLSIGPVVRFANVNGDWEKPYLGGELRYNFSPKFNIGFEYGSAKGENNRAHKGFGIRLNWNIH